MTLALKDPLSAVAEFIKITTVLSTERNLNRLLNMIVTSARTIAHADGGIITLLDSTKRNLCIEVLQNDSVQLHRSHYPHIPLMIEGQRNEQNICVYAAFSGKTVNIDDVYQYSGFDFTDFYHFDEWNRYRTKSVLTVPLVDHQELTVGVLQLINAKDCGGRIVKFAEPIEQVVRAFAAQAAVAIDNVQLIDENARLIQLLNQTTETLESENRRLRSSMGHGYDFSKIIGDSPAIRKVFALMSKVVNTDATVLITGETGTGKELVAHAIHYNSTRRDHEFVTQNCAALPENLLESELFGYKKGAFSGANADKKGLVEQANGGTLFLDEIGDMPLSLQAKLLRVLQEKEVRPLGALKPVRINVRVVAATHCDLAKKVKDGQFRQDLYYRLTVFPIELPPLRIRKEDLPALIRHFVEGFAKKYEKRLPNISPAVLDILTRYEYPGNIRELRNIVERAMLLCEDGGSLMPDHLPEELWTPSARGSALSFEAARKNGGLRELVEAYEARIIRDKLRDCKGNQTRAAEELQVGRRTLIDKIQRYQLERSKDTVTS